MSVEKLKSTDSRVEVFKKINDTFSRIDGATTEKFGTLRVASSEDEKKCTCNDAAITPNNFYNLNDFRKADTGYAVGDTVGCAYHNDLQLKCTFAGITENGVLDTSGKLTEGQTLQDGTVVWQVEKIGVFKANPAFGIFNNAGTLTVNKASDDQIIAKTNLYRPLTPANIDLAVKTGITTNSIELSDEEKKTAQEWLGISSGTPIGTIIQLNASSTYVPDGCLPCDGAEYTQSQFNDLWGNYLKGKIVVSDLFKITSGQIEDGIYSGGTASVHPTSVSDEVIYCFQLGEDVTTHKNIGIFDLAIRNGSCYATSTPIIDVTANGKLYVKFTFEDNSTNTTYPYKAKYSCSTDNVTYKNVGTMSINGLFATVSNPLPVILTQSYYNSTPLAETKSLLNTCTYSQYQSDISTYGQCGKFAVDTTNGKFRVPLIKDGAVIQQALSDIELGKSYNAGLPNVTGSITVKSSAGNQTQLLTDSAVNVEQSGALYISAKRTAYGIGQSSETNSSSPKDLSIDASLSNSIYGNSDTVQMNAIALRYFVVVANGQTSQSMMDWSAWASSLQGKANIDGSNWNSSVKNVDSAFVTKVLMLSTSTAIGTYEIDLSDYLPNDGYVYEIELRGYAYRTGSSSGFCFLSSTLCPADTSENYDHFVSSANGVISKGNWCRIFVGSDRKMTKIIRDEAFSACVVNAIGYRRIGTNV